MNQYDQILNILVTNKSLKAAKWNTAWNNKGEKKYDEVGNQAGGAALIREHTYTFGAGIILFLKVILYERKE